MKSWLKHIKTENLKQPAERVKEVHQCKYCKETKPVQQFKQIAPGKYKKYCNKCKHRGKLYDKLKFTHEEMKRFRTRRYQLTDYYQLKEWIELREFYNDTCLKCKTVTKRISVDHVIPLAKQGSPTIENIQPLCKACNEDKADETTDYRTKKEITFIKQCIQRPIKG